MRIWSGCQFTLDFTFLNPARWSMVWTILPAFMPVLVGAGQRYTWGKKYWRCMKSKIKDMTGEGKHNVNYLRLFIICLHCMCNCVFLMSFHIMKILKAFLIRLIVVNSIIKQSAHNEHNVADTHNVQNLYYSMQHGKVHYVIWHFLLYSAHHRSKSNLFLSLSIITNPRQHLLLNLIMNQSICHLKMKFSFQ